MKIRHKTAKHTCFIAHGLKQAYESINYMGKMMSFCLCRVGRYDQKGIEIEIKINMFVNKLGSEFHFISFQSLHWLRSKIRAIKYLKRPINKGCVTDFLRLLSFECIIYYWRIDWHWRTNVRPVSLPFISHIKMLSFDIVITIPSFL